MADPLKPIIRNSITEPLCKIYGDGTSARNPALNNTFGQGAKNAGKPGYASTNFVDQLKDFNTEFNAFSRGSFTAKALNYAVGRYNHNSIKYQDSVFPCK